MTKRWKPKYMATVKTRNGTRVSIERNIIQGTCSYGFEGNDINIAIDDRLGEFDTLDTLIHEWLHAEVPNSPEKDVDSLSTSIARMLWKIGYRRRVKK